MDNKEKKQLLVIKTPTENPNILEKFNFRITSNEDTGEKMGSHYIKEYSGGYMKQMLENNTPIVEVEKIDENAK
jgi:hypothetical protein